MKDLRCSITGNPDMDWYICARHIKDNHLIMIYVVDSLDRERIGKAKAEFQTIIGDPFMLNSVILVFANKQDMVCSTKRPSYNQHHKMSRQSQSLLFVDKLQFSLGDEFLLKPEFSI
ncbi:hypothetical protein Taro_028691 [Colocasia esculenta]|uniref:Uncharacterized protein n=1 Tax=Colocasia esculenta TaxID=4460 RepID=A0A843VY03_COLES|nr:hypothetical protein [Colocasia esculenta]